MSYKMIAFHPKCVIGRVQMSDHENRQLIEQAYAKFKAGDIPTLLQSMSEYITWQLPEIENVPFSGKRQGRGAVGEFFSTLASLQDARSFEEREFIAQGDKVVVLGHYVWAGQSQWAHHRGRLRARLHRPRWSDPSLPGVHGLGRGRQSVSLGLSTK
jgi:ketosteroid isomerase-like protein